MLRSPVYPAGFTAKLPKSAIKWVVEKSAEKSAESVGLCFHCRNARVIRSDRGSIFYLCQLSKTDASCAKYPALPVRECRGYQSVEGID